MKSEDEIRSGMRVILEDSYVKSVLIEDKKITITCSEATLRFKDMARIADLLGTEHLDFTNDTEYGGYCDTCRYEETVLVITAKYE